MLSRIFLTVYRLDSKALATLSFGTLIPYGVVWAEIEYKVHVALPIGPINQFKPVQQSRQQTLKIRQSKINSRWVAEPIGQMNRRPRV